MPRRHHSAIDESSPPEAGALAAVLQDGVGAARRVGSAYNVLFMNFPRETKSHFYVAIVPRLAAQAGFELATGTFIDIIDPAAAARALR